MGFTGLDGGIMVALAAGLWLVYLMPTWFKRREYAALEKTNVRRQQAIRILQETEPIAVRERVNAIVSPTGQIENPDKLNEAIQRSKAAQAARLASRQIAEEAASGGQGAASRARVARRLRRTRAVVLLLLMAALITVVVQAALMITTGIGAGAWAVLGFSAVAAIVSFSALGRLAAIARRRQAPVAAPVARPIRQRVVEEREAARPPVATWTPVSVPKPLYLSRSEAQAPAAPSVDHMERLRAAALESDRALREAQEAPEVAPITKPETPLGAPSKYAAMGVVGKADVTGTDLDEVLRRRRAG